MATNFIPKIVYGDDNVEISFTYPPSVDNGEYEEASTNVSTSISGENQVSLNHTEFTREVTYLFLTEAQLDDLRQFFENHARYGRTFKYYIHASEADYLTYELKEYTFNPTRVAPRGTGFLYEISFVFRRAEA